MNIPSYLIKAGDTVEIKEKCKSSQRYKDVLETTNSRLVPDKSGSIASFKRFYNKSSVFFVF